MAGMNMNMRKKKMSIYIEPRDYTTLFLFYKKKTCAKRKTNMFLW